ncbi:MAG: hypothetical protein E7403_00630 [Ruminococcaceae bacterium]|nr:hypothetical protein [Oscillospiraceae bacterium]
MFSLKMLNIVATLMILSIGFLLGEIFRKKTNENYKKFLKYASIVFLVISAILLIWLPVNKELFHWHYDIATGEPVDHYSTYGKCITYTGIALVSSGITFFANIKKKL